MLNKQQYDRLKEVHTEMHALLSEAKELLRKEGGTDYEQAKATWIGNIDSSLGEGDYVENYNGTFARTLRSVEPLDLDDETEASEDYPWGPKGEYP